MSHKFVFFVICDTIIGIVLFFGCKTFKPQKIYYYLVQLAFPSDKTSFILNLFNKNTNVARVLHAD